MKLSINNTSHELEMPLYVNTMQKIRSQIESGELQQGSRLPAERLMAKELGISRATMSKALVELGREGFLVRHVGRGTFVANKKPAKNKTVRIVVEGLQKTLADEYYVGLHRGIQDVALNESMDVMYASAKDGDYQSLFDSRRPDGLLLIDPYARFLPEVQALYRQGVPFVILGASWPDIELPCVDSNNYSAAAKAVQYLYSLGHRRIGGIFVDTLHANSPERRRGFESSMAQHGLEFHRDWCIDDIVDGTQHLDDIHMERIKNMVLEPNGPTAFFCGGYHLASETMKIIKQTELTVPGHISIVGFDGLHLAAQTRPALTTLRQPLQKMGRRAMQKLLAIINGDSNSYGKELFDMELVIRDSCAPPA